MTPMTKLLSIQARQDIVRAFRTALQLEQEELNNKRYYLRVATTQPVKDLLKKQIQQAEFEIHSLHFTFGQLTGMAFNPDFSLKKETIDVVHPTVMAIPQ